MHLLLWIMLRCKLNWLDYVVSSAMSRRKSVRYIEWLLFFAVSPGHGSWCMCLKFLVTQICEQDTDWCGDSRCYWLAKGTEERAWEGIIPGKTCLLRMVWHLAKVPHYVLFLIGWGRSKKRPKHVLVCLHTFMVSCLHVRGGASVAGSWGEGGTSSTRNSTGL